MICDITDNLKANQVQFSDEPTEVESCDLNSMCAYSHMFWDFYDFEENRGLVRDSLWFY